MGDPLSTAIAVGGQLLGGLLGRKNTTKESWKGSYGALVGHAQGAIEGARRTGFNPLTLLGASPASGIPGDNSAFGQSVANAAMLLADEIATNKKTVDKLNAYQTQNLRLQRRLDTVSVRSPVPGVYGGARQPSDPEVYGDASSDTDDRLGDPVLLADGSGGGIAVPDPRLDRGAGAYLGGYRWESAPGWSSGQTIEDEYGDLASWGYGIAKIAADTGHNLRRVSDYYGVTDRGDFLGMSDPSDARRGVERLSDHWRKTTRRTSRAYAPSVTMP